LPGRKGKRILAEDSAKKADVRRFLKGMADGEMVCPAKGSQASGTIASMALCNCLIELPAQSGGKKGEEVWVQIL
jgi:molybdopterin molybdotransferase